MADQRDGGIAWTDATWNPVRGCSRVSSGCTQCYAERVAARFSGPGMPYEGLARIGKNGPRWTGEVRLVPEHLADPLRWKRPRRVFVNSMSDLFHEGLTNEQIAEVFLVMQLCRQHTFQILTKRAARMRDWFSWRADRCDLDPLPNVWLGVSCEDQATADERIPLLLETPAAVRFISYEPALGPLQLHPGILGCVGHLAESFGNPLIHWVIVGGESGPGARPFDSAWAESIVEQCKAAQVAVFVKQLGAWAHDSVERLALKDRKGGDWNEWPEALRVREFPR